MMKGNSVSVIPPIVASWIACFLLFGGGNAAVTARGGVSRPRLSVLASELAQEAGLNCPDGDGAAMQWAHCHGLWGAEFWESQRGKWPDICSKLVRKHDWKLDDFLLLLRLGRGRFPADMEEFISRMIAESPPQNYDAYEIDSLKSYLERCSIRSSLGAIQALWARSINAVQQNQVPTSDGKESDYSPYLHPDWDVRNRVLRNLAFWEEMRGIVAINALLLAPVECTVQAPEQSVARWIVQTINGNVNLGITVRRLPQFPCFDVPKSVLEAIILHGGTPVALPKAGESLLRAQHSGYPGMWCLFANGIPAYVLSPIPVKNDDQDQVAGGTSGIRSATICVTRVLPETPWHAGGNGVLEIDCTVAPLAFEILRSYDAVVTDLKGDTKE